MNKKPLTVLLIEDDRDLAESIHEFLKLENIICDHAYNGLSGFQLASDNNYDVILLDVMLPKQDGLSVCEDLRKAGIDTPVLMLTARDTLEDKLAGFSSGSDDYLVKPFALEELVARLQVLSYRRSGQIKTLIIGDLEFDVDTQVVFRAGVELKLTPSCRKILEALMRASPKMLTRQELEKTLWQDEPPDSNSLKVHLFNLRKSVNKPFDSDILHTLTGRGFLIKADGIDE